MKTMSDQEQARLLLALPREEFVATIFGQAMLTGHPISDDEIENAYRQVRAVADGSTGQAI